MNAIALTDIAFEPDMDHLRTRLHLDANSAAMSEVEALINEAKAVARPKALYKMAFVLEKGDDSVVIDDVLFNSRVLRVNLDAAHRVFAFVATCGTEIDAWARGADDVLRQYYAEMIKESALASATRALDAHLQARFGLGKTSRMNPGSLPDWPLKEQRPLFALLGDPQNEIGVELTQSLLMVPNKSVSGVSFETDGGFQSCQLCPREACPGRRAPHDSGLYDRKYRMAATDSSTPSMPEPGGNPQQE